MVSLRKKTKRSLSKTRRHRKQMGGRTSGRTTPVDKLKLIDYAVDKTSDHKKKFITNKFNEISQQDIESQLDEFNKLEKIIIGKIMTGQLSDVKDIKTGFFL